MYLMSTISTEILEDKNYSEKMTCSVKTKKLIMLDCKQEFLYHHPELKGTKITQGQMLLQLAIFYLKE